MTHNKNSTRYYSNIQERRVAKAVGGKTVANSGASLFGKGDIRTDNVLIECKTVTKPAKSFSIKKEWLDKNEEEAFAMGKFYSALAFNFGPDEPNYYVVNEKMFQMLLNVVEVF